MDGFARLQRHLFSSEDEGDDDNIATIPRNLEEDDAWEAPAAQIVSPLLARRNTSVGNVGPSPSPKHSVRSTRSAPATMMVTSPVVSSRSPTQYGSPHHRDAKKQLMEHMERIIELEQVSESTLCSCAAPAFL